MNPLCSKHRFKLWTHFSKMCFLLTLIVMCQMSISKTLRLMDDMDGDVNYLIVESKKTIAPDLYTFKTITNFKNPQNQGYRSAVSKYLINCRIARIGYLDWWTYAKPMGKGKRIDHDPGNHFEDIKDDPRHLEFLRIFCPEYEYHL